jgi:hypothetical protein
VSLSGNLLQDYRVIQPYLTQVISTQGKQIATTPEGHAVMEFVATINGQQVVVRAVQLANNVLQITDAWVKTR